MKKINILKCPGCGSQTPEVYEILMVTCNQCYRSEISNSEEGQAWHVQVEAEEV